MLKMRTRLSDGRELLILGLSQINLDRLKADQPIAFKGDTVGLPGLEIMIFAGETEQSMARDLSEFVGPNTRASISKRATDA
jgi:hypothetical protein